jgi:protein phosphatase
MAEPSSLRVVCHGRTVTGRVRHNNEDTLWAGRLGDPAARAGDREAYGSMEFPGMLLAVADGMGGALAGEVASRLAVETLAEDLAKRSADARKSAGAVGVAGSAAVQAANARIRAEGDQDPARYGMGTTLTVAWVVNGAAELFQVGDSRAYLLREGRFEQLTKDQSLVGKLIEDGIISEEEAERVAGKHIILQALGSEEALDVVHRTVPLKPQDTLLLCTDGLSGLVRNSAIEAELKRNGPLEDMVNRLIAKAEDEGGTDNITVLLARVQAG